jgi:hypothetical protein
MVRTGHRLEAYAATLAFRTFERSPGVMPGAHSAPEVTTPRQHPGVPAEILLLELILSKRGHHVDLIEHLQHKGIGCRLLVERYGQIGPNHERHAAVGVVAHERVEARDFAAVKIDGVRTPANLDDAVPIPLALGLTLVLGLQAVEPAALICGVEQITWPTS